MSQVEFHFALENIFGKGKIFLLKCIIEAEIFNKAEIIDSKKVSWSDLYNMKNKN